MKPLKIRVLNGKLKGYETAIKPNLIVSRDKGKGCFYVKDPAASNPHAKIIQKRQKFYLQDMNSKNGTYVEGEVNDLFPLKHDLIFRIGRTQFQIVTTQASSTEEQRWETGVAEAIKKHQSAIKDKKHKLVSFKKILCLRFLSGVQKSNEWFMSYGPRYAGSAELDLPILEPEAPDLCFSLHPYNNGQGILFKTPCPNKVLMNQKHIPKKMLEEGDLISIAKTGIEVSFNIDKNVTSPVAKIFTKISKHIKEKHQKKSKQAVKRK